MKRLQSEATALGTSYPPSSTAPSKESCEPSSMSRTNYIFIDFENLQEIDLDRIMDKPVKVVLVLGERHKYLPVALVKKLIKYAPQVSLVETGRSGKNALDLVLAHHIGHAKKDDPHGYFHILSGDKDFDALVGHLKDNGTLAARRAAFAEIPVLMDNDERVDFLARHFSSKGISRAGKRKTLESQIQALFGKALSPAELSETINTLITRKTLEITPEDEVVYRL
jgi:hypothetical protein